jgi:endonuclease/exonuclease/phosphatase (EEP) superfamily protein YafD
MRLRQVGVALTMIALLVALLGLSLGGFGATVPKLDILAQFSGHFIGVACSASIALMIRWRPLLTTLLGTFITLATHSLIAEARPAPGPLPAMLDGRPLVRVSALNAWHNNSDPEALVGFLTSDHADIVMLAEFGPNKLELLHRLENLYPYRAGCAAVWGCSMMILSRRPFTASGSTADRGFGPLPRAWVRFGSGENSLTVIAIHAIKPIDSPLLQRVQLTELAADVRSAPGHVIVGGDFNATPWSFAFNKFRRESALRPVATLLPSYPAGDKGLPQLAIDHIFVSPKLEVVTAGIGPETGSDHRPIVAGLTLPAGVVWPDAAPILDPVPQPLAMNTLR